MHNHPTQGESNTTFGPTLLFDCFGELFLFCFFCFWFCFLFFACFVELFLFCIYFVFSFNLFSTSPEVAIPCQVNDVQCIVAIWYRLVKQSGCNDLFSEKSRIQLSACSTPQQLVSVASAGVSHSMVWNQDSGWLFPYNIWLNSLN